MKITRVVSILGILGLLFALVPAAAAGAPPGNWVSGIACQNLSPSDSASITLKFYQEGSGSEAPPALSYNDTIPANGSKNYYTPSSPPGVPSGFLGAVVVSSSQPLACNVNTQTTGAGTSSDPYRIGTSAGFSDTQTAPTMFAPQVMKNFDGTWSSYIAVQNTSASEISVQVTYKDRFGNPVGGATETSSVKAQSNKVFYQTDNAGLPNGFLGSAVVKAQDGVSGLAVTVNFYNSGSSASTSQLHSYNGFSAGASMLFVPRFVRNYYGYNGGFSIQNMSDTTAATVKIDFTFAGSTYTYNSPSIDPGAALPLYAPNIAAINAVDGKAVSQRFGSAVITVLSGGPVVAIVNEDNRGGSGVPAERVGQGSTYNAISDGDQSNTVFFAQVVRKAVAPGIFSGGFQVANTTGTAGTCDITYSGAAAANEMNVSLPANGSFLRFAPNVANLPNGFNSSVSVDCTQPVVGISNLAVEVGSGRYGDSFTQANGLNQ